jgi:hypothetical protein
MKSRKILTILVLALSLMICQAEVGSAGLMGTAWTYQGRLIDANDTADGLYDFEFKLFDDPCTGTQQGSTVDINDLDVIDGYFTVELDFGGDPNIFNGDARWLETAVRPGDSNDPNAYTILAPRQELTPSPYASYAKTAGSVAGGINGSGTANYIAKFTDSNTIGDSAIYERSGNVAIGTTMITGRKLGVLASHSYAGHFHNTYTGGGDAFAVYGKTDGTGGWDRFGLYGLATGGSQNNYGVYGIAYGDEGLNCGVYGSASGQGSNYAAYLEGNVMVHQGNLYIPSSGQRVGIGTVYPTEALTISSNSTSRTGIRLRNTSNAEQYNYNIHVRGSISPARDGNLEIWRNDTYGNPSQVGVVIQPDGDVGIGTTTPGSKLQVAGMVHSSSGGFKFPDGTTQTTAASGDGHSLDASDGSPTNVVYVNSIGNVGVGTTSPGAKLDVEGYIQTQDNLPFSIRRYTGTLGSIGTLTFSHGIGNGHHKGLIVQAWCKGNTNEMMPMDVEYMDGGRIRIINGIAYRPYRVTIMYTSSDHVW